VAESAPEADRYFTDEALTLLGRYPNIGVGSARAYDVYAPLRRQMDYDPSSSEVNIERLRRLLNRPNFSGFDEVPWLEHAIIDDLRGSGSPILNIQMQEGRHRSLALGDRRVPVGLTPADHSVPATLDQLHELPVYPQNFIEPAPPLSTYYDLFSHGGPV
jgi:hypothetical protein